MRGPGFAPFVAAQGQRERQPPLRPGDAHVAQPPLLVDGRAVGGHRAMVRQQPFFHAHHVDLGKLQPLGGVQRHQRHGVALQFRFLVAIVLVAGQGDLLQKAGQRRLRRPAGSTSPRR